MKRSRNRVSSRVRKVPLGMFSSSPQFEVLVNSSQTSLELNALVLLIKDLFFSAESLRKILWFNFKSWETTTGYALENIPLRNTNKWKPFSATTWDAEKSCICHVVGPTGAWWSWGICQCLQMYTSQTWRDSSPFSFQPIWKPVQAPNFVNWHPRYSEKCVCYWCSQHLNSKFAANIPLLHFIFILKICW